MQAEQPDATGRRYVPERQRGRIRELVDGHTLRGKVPAYAERPVELHCIRHAEYCNDVAGPRSLLQRAQADIGSCPQVVRRKRRRDGRCGERGHRTDAEHA